MMTTYDAPQRREQLRDGLRTLHKAIPGQMRGFSDLHRAAMADGALSTREKELMALAIGICQHCADCITLHVHDALRAGATPEQINETVGVAIVMGGGPASVYATLVTDALEQFSAVAVP